MPRRFPPPPTTPGAASTTTRIPATGSRGSCPAAVVAWAERYVAVVAGGGAQRHQRAVEHSLKALGMGREAGVLEQVLRVPQTGQGRRQRGRCPEVHATGGGRSERTRGG